MHNRGSLVVITRSLGEGRPACGTTAISLGLWIALAAAVVQLTSIGSDFYMVGEHVRDAWLGIPHATQLVLPSALTTSVLAGLAAGGRSPVSGRTAGIVIAVVGLVAVAQIGYRMLVPPFQGCLTYNCGFEPKADVTLLAGIWMALIGSIVAVVGGVLHAASRVARQTPGHFWRSHEQTGMTPWLGIASLSAAVMFLLGHLLLPFYTVQGGPADQWTAWGSIPHTAGLVLLMAGVIIGLAVAAGRGRSPMTPTGLGATIAVLALVATARHAYRMVVSPFYSGPAEGVFTEGADINLAAWLGLVFGILTIVAGIVHAAQHRDTRTSTARPETAASPG